MQLKLGSIFILALIATVVLVGCEVTRDMVVDTMSSMDTEIIDATDLIPSTDTEMADMESNPVKLVWLVNYPVGGKDAYIAWIATVAPTLLAPKELRRLASYDNARGEYPHRLVEFDFDRKEDAKT